MSVKQRTFQKKKEKGELREETEPAISYAEANTARGREVEGAAADEEGAIAERVDGSDGGGEAIVPAAGGDGEEAGAGAGREGGGTRGGHITTMS